MTIKTIAAIVAGTGFEGRDKRIRAFCADGAKCKLERQPNNPHDPNAIAVSMQVKFLWGLIKLWGDIGYIKTERAQSLAKKLDEGKIRILDARVHSFYAADSREHPRVSLRIDIEEV